MANNLIKINSYSRWVYITENQDFGGVHFQIQMSGEFDMLMSWVEKHKSRLEAEEQARNTHPAVKELYEEYQTALNLVSE